MRLSYLRKRAAVTVAAASIAIPTFLTVSPAAAQDVPDAKAPVGANAVDEEAQATIAAADPAPQCVDAFSHEHTFSKDVHLHNQCNSRIRVKVIVAFGPDSDCKNLAKGGTATHSWWVGWPYFASRFDALVKC